MSFLYPTAIAANKIIKKTPAAIPKSSAVTGIPSGNAPFLVPLFPVLFVLLPSG